MHSHITAHRSSLCRLLVFTVCAAILPIADFSLLIRTKAHSQSTSHAGHPRRAKPEGDLPDLEDVKSESGIEREAPAPIPSTQRSPKVPLRPWDGRRVGDPDARNEADQGRDQVRRAHARKRNHAPILLTLAANSCYAQSASRGAVMSAPKRGGLEITSHLVDNKYCPGGTMLLTLASEYRNIGDNNLILFKYALPAFQYRVSKDSEAAKAKRYEQVISPTMGWAPSHIKFGSEPPTEWFVILKPQQSYRPINTIKVLLVTTDTDTTDTDKQGVEHDLHRGEHVLQLMISTWPLDDKLGRELRTRWEAFGSLWTESLLSIPMKFRVDEPTKRAPADCNEPVK